MEKNDEIRKKFYDMEISLTSEIERLNHVIENKNNDIENMVDIIETTNKELYELREMVFNNPQYVLIDVLKIVKNISVHNPDVEHNELIDTITNYFTLFKTPDGVICSS